MEGPCPEARVTASTRPDWLEGSYGDWVGMWGDERALGPTVGAFVDDEGGYTTVAVAVALLVSLQAILGSAAAQWVDARSAEVQQVADAVALSGENAVAAYSTVAQVLDACVLSMGLAGFVTCGAGLRSSCVPGRLPQGAHRSPRRAPGCLTLGGTSRGRINEGLQRLEGLLPLSSPTRDARANSREGLDYGMRGAISPGVGSTFGALEDGADGTPSRTWRTVWGRSPPRRRRPVRGREAPERGWMADCGSSPYCLRERAAHLAGLADAQNPDYASTLETGRLAPRF